MKIVIELVIIGLVVSMLPGFFRLSGLVKSPAVKNSDDKERLTGNVTISDRKLVSPHAFLVNFVYKSLGAIAGGLTKQSQEETQVQEQVTSKAVPFEPVTEEKYRIDEKAFNGCDGEVVTPTDPNGQYVLYIHGGGFTSGSAKERREITTYLASEYGFTVYANNYRLAPEVGLSDMQEDCLNYYLGILDSGVDPQNLIVMGESGGAHLSLTLGLILRDRGLSQPKAFGIFSPPVEYVEQYPSPTENIPTDFMLGDSINHMDWEEIFDCTSEELKDPYKSPIRGNFTGVAPVFIGVSDYETLYDDSLMLYQKLQKENHETALDVQHGLVHAYVIFGKMKETRDSISHFVSFINM